MYSRCFSISGIPPPARSKAVILRLAFLLIILLLNASHSFAQENNVKKVLILNSYHPGYSWSDSIMAGLREEFDRADLQITLLQEFMDTKNHRPEDLYPTLGELYRLKYGLQQQPDLIITSDNNALNFVLTWRQRLFPDIPVVFCGINNFTDDLIRGQTEITGIAEDHGYMDTISLVQRLHPERKRYVAISDSTESAQLNMAAFSEAVKTIANQIDLIELTGLPVAELKRQLKLLPNDGVLFHLDYYRDSEGKVFTVEESFALLRDNSTLPIYVNTDNKVGFGAVGGVVATGRLQGLTAARIAIKILKGESPAAIPVLRRAPTEPVFDYNLLSEFKIPFARLPENSRIINRPKSFYYQYKYYIWLTVLFLVAQSMIIFSLVRNIRQRRESAKELARWAHVFENAQWGIAVGDHRRKR